MESDRSENENELTSSMGNLMSGNKDEKSDGSDSTPTSSTDAFATTSVAITASDDPISSTSSDVIEIKKSDDKFMPMIKGVNATMENKEEFVVDHISSIVSEGDLLVMNITDTSTEKITEDVEDIVQDLENLLGEPTTSFSFPVKSFEIRKDISDVSKSKPSLLEVDKLTADFEVTTGNLLSTSDQAEDVVTEASTTQNVQLPDKITQKKENESLVSSDIQDESSLPNSQLVDPKFDTRVHENIAVEGISSEAASGDVQTTSEITSTDLSHGSERVAESYVTSEDIPVIMTEKTVVDAIPEIKEDLRSEQFQESQLETAEITHECEIKESLQVEANQQSAPVAVKDSLKINEIPVDMDRAVVNDKSVKNTEPHLEENNVVIVEQREVQNLVSQEETTSNTTSEFIQTAPESPEVKSVQQNVTENVDLITEEKLESPTIIDDVTEEGVGIIHDEISVDKENQVLDQNVFPEQTNKSLGTAEGFEGQDSDRNIPREQTNDISETVQSPDEPTVDKNIPSAQNDGLPERLDNFEEKIVDKNVPLEQNDEPSETMQSLEEQIVDRNVPSEQNDELSRTVEDFEEQNANKNVHREENDEFSASVESSEEQIMDKDVPFKQNDELSGTVERNVSLVQNDELSETVEGFEEPIANKNVPPEENDEFLETVESSEEQVVDKNVPSIKNDVLTEPCESSEELFQNKNVISEENVETLETVEESEEQVLNENVNLEQSNEFLRASEGSEEILPDKNDELSGSFKSSEGQVVDQNVLSEQSDEPPGISCEEHVVDKIVISSQKNELSGTEEGSEGQILHENVILEESDELARNVENYEEQVFSQNVSLQQNNELLESAENSEAQVSIITNLHSEQSDELSSIIEDPEGQVVDENVLSKENDESLGTVENSEDQVVDQNIILEQNNELSETLGRSVRQILDKNIHLERNDELLETVESSESQIVDQDVPSQQNDELLDTSKGQILDKTVPLEQNKELLGAVEISEEAVFLKQNNELPEAIESSEGQCVDKSVIPEQNNELCASVDGSERIQNNATSLITESLQSTERLVEERENTGFAVVSEDIKQSSESITSVQSELTESMTVLEQTAEEFNKIPGISTTEFAQVEDQTGHAVTSSEPEFSLDLMENESQDEEVLNAVSALIREQNPDFVSKTDMMVSQSESQTNFANIPLEAPGDETLPSVDDIIAESAENLQSADELQDDNLETLLAVANLQNVCGSDVNYEMSPIENVLATEEISERDESSAGEDQKETESVVSITTSENVSNQEVRSSEVTSTRGVGSCSCSIEIFKISEVVTEIKEDYVGEETISTSEDKIEQTTGVESQVEERAKRVGSNVDEIVSSLEETVSTTKSEIGNTSHQVSEEKLKEPLLINIEDSERERQYSPKIKIKPIKPPEEEIPSTSSESDEAENTKGSLKMTITKQSDTMHHSILKIYDPSDDTGQEQDHVEPTVPKLIIKPIVQSSEQYSPKRSNKQVFSPPSSGTQRSSSPRITRKTPEAVSPLKITIKPVLKPEECHRQKHSPKLTIKPIIKPDEDGNVETKLHSPRVKAQEEFEQACSPRITIKPIVKPTSESNVEATSTTPRVTIKPVIKPQEKGTEIPETTIERSSPKITIKPVVKPQDIEQSVEDFEEEVKERIVLKINKGNIPGSSKELKKREAPPPEEEKSEKLAKIKLKFSKEGGHPHIVQDEASLKRPLEILDYSNKAKKLKVDNENILSAVIAAPVSPIHSKLKEMLCASSTTKFSSDKIVPIADDVTIAEQAINKGTPIVISEESNQDSINAAMELKDPLAAIPVFEITPDSVKTLNPQPPLPTPEVPPAPPAPRKRGRPRKVPLQVREEFKDPKEEEPKPVVFESLRPKRSCRGQSVRTTLGIKPRKPRGPGRGRGGKRGMGTRATTSRTSPSPLQMLKEPKVSRSRQMKEDLSSLSARSLEIDDGFPKSSLVSVLAPPPNEISNTDRADIVMYEEETRMSAETSSRAHTPAKQVLTTVPSQADLVEESQSSVQSTATTESTKARKGSRLEVQEPEGAVISADQLAEYYWMGGGPYMLQEQVAQFLGIKSFKRKYPNIQRRVVDMQERDFIRESGLACESMCDLGLTAVNSADILDIMYSDFQDKYEEYCKHQRDRQAKDLTNKQKALSLAASQEKNKMDILQQAVQSAASWNATFNKTRKEQRKACMDLQTLTVHYPKGKMKQINKPKLGNYPVALVPGQYTDYYKEFTPTEVNNLPLNTLCYDSIIKETIPTEMDCDSQTDGSGSESDTSSSDSDSSYSGSSDGENCTVCKPAFKRVAAAQ